MEENIEIMKRKSWMRNLQVDAVRRQRRIQRKSRRGSKLPEDFLRLRRIL